MDKPPRRDIFISYKNDGEGRNFAARICADLQNLGYSVYYNPNEQHSGSFPQRLTAAVSACTDFLLIVTQPCLDQLMRHEKVDWVREEVLTAHRLNKNIIPLLMPGVSMPKDASEMPEDLRFLPHKDAITMTDPYDCSPLDFLRSWLKAQAMDTDRSLDIFNGSSQFDVTKDLEAMEAVCAGNPDVMYQLANYYYFGIAGGEDGCRRNYVRAYELLSALEKTEGVYAAYAGSLIAEMYFNGIVPRQSQSFARAYSLHEKARSVSGFSAREYAYMKSRGCGCEFDYSAIEQSYRDAIDQGDDMATLRLAEIYMENGQFRKAAALYRSTTRMMPQAEHQLGMMYRNGVLEDPPRPDYFRAAFYFQHAIESGQCDADTYYQLGRLYFAPTGDFPKDFRLAERYFLQAVEKGSKEAHSKLGLIYEYGLTVRDVHRAVRHHAAAAAFGNAVSAYHLAMLYAEPEVRNYQKAAEYACIAAKKGVMEGEYLFGMYLLYGRGCEPDENRAYKYFSKAFAHGMPQAEAMMRKIDANRK